MAKRISHANIPPTLSPGKSIELLRRQLMKAREILANRPICDATEQGWKVTTKDVLLKAFGSDSHNVDAVMQIGELYFVPDYTDGEWEQKRAENFSTRIAVLRDIIELLEAEHNPPTIIPTTLTRNSNTNDAATSEDTIVRAFISYSWDSEAHKDWVRDFADAMIRNGVATTLDQYDLPPGGDRFQFMEKNVRESDYVLCICTPAYVKRANERQKGVGVETSLITPRFFEQNATKTFIPIIRAADDNLYTPDYMSALIFVDFRDDAKFAVNLEELLRLMHKQPKYVKPALGPVPTFGTKGGMPSTVPAIATDTINNHVARVLGSKKDDWRYFDDKGLFVFNSDPNLTIQQREIDYDTDRFVERWVEKFPDPVAFRSLYEIRVNGTAIHQETLVNVDGGRMMMPMPDSPVNLVVEPDRDKIARLLNQFNPHGAEYDRYMQTAGLRVKV